MSDLTRDVILRISAKNLSTADFQTATAAVNQLTAAVDKQIEAASRGVIKEKELTESLNKLDQAGKSFQGFAKIIENLRGLDTQIAAQITKLAQAKTAWETQKAAVEAMDAPSARQQNRLEGLKKAFDAAEVALNNMRTRQAEYSNTLQRNGLDAQNLVNAERQLLEVVDRAGAAVNKLTQARDSYARILRQTREEEERVKQAAKEAADAEAARAAAIQRVIDALERERAAQQAAALAAAQAGVKEYIAGVEAKRKAEADFQKQQLEGIEKIRAARMEAIRKEVEANNKAHADKAEAERKHQAEMDALSAKARAALTPINQRFEEDQQKARMAAIQQQIEANNRLHQERRINEQNAERNARGVLGRLREEIQLQRQSVREHIDGLKARVAGYRDVRTAIGEADRADEQAAARQRSRRTQGGQTGRPNLLGLEPYQMTNLGYQGVDVVQGFLSGVSPGIIAAQQGPQIVQIFGTAVLKWAPLIVAGLASIGVAVGALNRVFREQASTREFLGQLTDNANAINFTVGQLNEVRKAARDMGMSWDDAGKAIRTAIDNNVAPQRLKQLLQMAQDVKDTTGKDVPAAMKEFTEAFHGGADALLKLNDAYHFLRPAQQQHIRDQFAAGEGDKARRETLELLATTLRDRAAVAVSPWTEAMRKLSKAWDDFLVSISKTEAFQTMNQWIIKTIENLGNLGKRVEELINQKGLGQTLVDALVGKDSVVGRAVDALRAKMGLPSLNWDGTATNPTSANPATAVVPNFPAGRFSEGKLPLDTDALRTLANLLREASTALPAGYRVEAISTERPGAVVRGTGTLSEHGFGRAIDVRIVDSGGKEVAGSMGAGGPLYRELDAAMAAAAKKYGIGPLAIGTTFGNRPDAGHYSLGGPEAVSNAARRGVTAIAGAGAVAPVTTAPTDEATREGQKQVEQQKEKERISRATSIEAEKQAEFARIEREVNNMAIDEASKKYLIQSQQREVAKKLDQEARDLAAKEAKERIDDARHYNEIRAAGDKAVVEAQAKNVTGWRELQRIRDQAQAQERDRLSRIDAENSRLQQVVKTVDDLKRANDNAYGTDVQRALDAIALKYKNLAADIKKARDEATQTDKAAYDAQLARLPAEQRREEAKATGAALLAQAEAAAAARNDLINSANKLRESGAVSIDEQQQKIKEAYALTTPEIEKATAALQEWIDLHKKLGDIPLITLEKYQAKLTELRTEMEYVDPFLKGLHKTIEESFTNRAAEAFDSAAEALGGLIAKTKDWKDVWTSLRNAAANFFAGILKDIATYIIKAQLAKMVSSFMPGLGGTATTTATSAVSAGLTGTASQVGATTALAVVHGGGIVGLTQTPRRAVEGDWFSRAPRYHNGAVVGLAANEQAAILQRGEEVLTASNPRHARNWGGGGGTQDINIRNVLVADPELVPSHMGSARGEKVIMSVLTRNAATVRQLVR